MPYDAEIPYGAYWSTPFAKWQGSLAHLNAVEFAAHVAKAELDRRSIDPTLFDYAVLGMTVPQRHSFYGAPWLTGMIGAADVSGPTLNQACATGARSLLAAAHEIGSGLATCALVVTCDRTSNGPHLYYPNPSGPGGTGSAENWVMDNFGCDPLGGHAMVDTADNVARRHQISTSEQHDVVLRRQAQYAEALADDRAFQKRYMTLPFDVPSASYRKALGTMEGDEGLFTSTEEGLAKLRPVKPDGTVTLGGQTHPADGNAALLVTTPDKAREQASDPSIRVALKGFGLARTDLAHMPEATIPAARQALEQAALRIDDMDAIKSHNPFAVNDIVFARETGASLDAMNNYGCSLIWGHPQAPTGLRAIIELIEELALRGGGTGLFQGCAAGDSAMAVVLTVSDRSA
ncbi:MAG: thiolase family protein [Pseudomonadota bacterium]